MENSDSLLEKKGWLLINTSFPVPTMCRFCFDGCFIKTQYQNLIFIILPGIICNNTSSRILFWSHEPDDKFMAYNVWYNIWVGSLKNSINLNLCYHKHQLNINNHVKDHQGKMWKAESSRNNSLIVLHNNKVALRLPELSMDYYH